MMVYLVFTFEVIFCLVPSTIVAYPEKPQVVNVILIGYLTWLQDLLCMSDSMKDFDHIAALNLGMVFFSFL